MGLFLTKLWQSIMKFIHFNKGFYQIYNQKDEIYNKGLSSFKEAAKISQ